MTDFLLSRLSFFKTFIDERRDVDHECGYPIEITTEQYKKMYSRFGLAKRIVQILPLESWKNDPEIYEDENEENQTDFETKWTELQEEKNLFHYLRRADILSGVGRFGVILLGINDGKPLDLPVEGINEKGEATNIFGENKKLLFVRTFDESVVSVLNYESDPTNPRYGQPIQYSIRFQENTLNSYTTKVTTVHWSRIIHIADGREMSEIYGTPRMECVFNTLADLYKIYGASGEMFWKGGVPSLVVGRDADVAGEVTAEGLAKLKENIYNIENHLSRSFLADGFKISTLQQQLADPTSHIRVQLDNISISLGIPNRILFGSEEAKLASTQDSKTWNSRLKDRQDKYISPMIIRPVINRLVAIGILPEYQQLNICWEDLNSPTDDDKATVALKKMQALSLYVTSGLANTLSPLDMWTKFFGMEKKEAESIDANATNLESSMQAQDGANVNA